MSEAAARRLGRQSLLSKHTARAVASMNGRTPNDRDSLQLKADLLCLGVRSNRYSSMIAALQNPGMATRTGHVGLQLLIESRCVNAPVLLPGTSEGFTEESPYDVWRDGHEWILRADG